jgi:hypothetical protein
MRTQRMSVLVTTQRKLSSDNEKKTLEGAIAFGAMVAAISPQLSQTQRGDLANALLTHFDPRRRLPLRRVEKQQQGLAGKPGHVGRLGGTIPLVRGL